MAEVELRQRASSLDNLNSAPALSSCRPQSIGCDPALSRPLHGYDELSGSNEDGVNLLGYRRVGTMRSLTSNERWHSDTNIASNPDQERSKLAVDKTELDIDIDHYITIVWDIKENVSAKDWIGLYQVGERTLAPHLSLPLHY